MTIAVWITRWWPLSETPNRMPAFDCPPVPELEPRPPAPELQTGR